VRTTRKGGCRLVHEAKGALDDVELLDPKLDARLVCDLLCRLAVCCARAFSLLPSR